MSRPPRRDTRIKDGEIRNPYGRNGKPKPTVDFLDEEITISLNGTATTVTRREALDHFLFVQATQGEIPAIRLLHRLHPGAPADEGPETASGPVAGGEGGAGGVPPTAGAQAERG